MLQPLINKNLELFTKRVETLTCYSAISQGSQISLLKRNNEAFVKTSIHLLVEDVLNHYTASEKVPAGFIPRLVQTILAKYWWMKVEEIAYVFNKGKNGEYGRSNKNISQDFIMDWLHQYDINEREIEMLEHNRRLQEERNKAQILSDDQLKDFYKKNKGVDNSEPIPDGSKRTIERKMDESDYQIEKLRILAELKNQKPEKQ